jgi:hypothetical protein
MIAIFLHLPLELPLNYTEVHGGLIVGKRMLYSPYIPLAEHFAPYEMGIHPKATLE